MRNIIETAQATPSLSTLVSAIGTAGLVDTLSGVGPFTVFAPTNDAFAKIPEDKLKALLADKAKLTSVLTYHVVPGKVLAKDIAGSTETTTVQGGKLKVASKDGVTINDAKVTRADIECSNGVVHLVDTVLMP